MKGRPPPWEPKVKHWLYAVGGLIAANLRAVQILIGYTKIESTVCYLGVDIEHALNLSESSKI